MDRPDNDDDRRDGDSDVRVKKKSFLKMFKLFTRDAHRVRFVCTNNLPEVPATWLPEENCYQVDETFKSGEEAIIYCRKHLFDFFADSQRPAEGPWGHHFQIRLTCSGNTS